MRDITLGDTFYHQFTTRQFSDGVPTVLTGSQALSVLEENNAVPITAGVSVAVDRGSVVGLNEATIVATSGNGYEVGKSYAIYISAGTVGGVSVVGEVVGHFTIEKSAAHIRLGAPNGASVSVDIADLPSNSELPSNFSSLSITAGGLIDVTQAAADKVWATAARILTASTNFNDVSTADVLAQVNAALDTAISELGVGIPTDTPTIRTALILMYMGLRNKVVVQTSATDALEFYNDGGTIICKKLLTDDGSDYEEAEMISG